jgi:nucleoid-associated protein YgaU
MAAIPVGFGPRPVCPRRSAPYLRLLPPLPAEAAGDPALVDQQAGPQQRVVIRPAPARGAAARPRPAPVRRLLPGVVLAGALAGTWLGAGALTGSRPAPTAGAHVAGASLARGQHYVVRAGDTLWTIALRLDPAGDPRPLVDELAAELPGGALQPGEVLTLP